MDPAETKEPSCARGIIDLTVDRLTSLETDLRGAISARNSARMRELLDQGLTLVSELPAKLQRSADPLAELVLPEARRLGKDSRTAAETIRTHDDFVLLPLFLPGSHAFPVAKVEQLRQKCAGQAK